MLMFRLALEAIRAVHVLSLMVPAIDVHPRWIQPCSHRDGVDVHLCPDRNCQRDYMRVNQHRVKQAQLLGRRSNGASE